MRRPVSKTAPAPVENEAPTMKAVDFKMLAESTSDVIIRCGMDGIATYVSPSIIHLLGLTPEAMIGQSHRSFIIPEDLPVLASTIAAHRAGQSNGRATYRMRRTDGTIVWVETSGRTVHDAATGTDDLVIVMRDISERKALEAQLSLLALTGATAKPVPRGPTGHHEPGRPEPRETRLKSSRMIN